MRPQSWAPSEISTIARGGACAPSACGCPTRTESATASPMAVPSPGLSVSSEVVTSARSCVGATPTAARVANDTTPTRNFSGTSSRNVFAATRAASRRVGSTSVAFIDRDTSSASTIVASSRGTLTVAWGRATPTIMNTSATSSVSGGRYRKRPGLRSTTFGSRSGLPNSACEATRRRSRSTYSATITGRTASAARARGQSNLTSGSCAGT